MLCSEWRRWERNLRHSKKKKQNEDGNIRLIHTDWAISVANVLSLFHSVSPFPFFHLPFLLLLGSNFKQYDFLQTCYFKGNESLRFYKCKGVFFPKESKRTTWDKSSFVLIILHLVNAQNHNTPKLLSWGIIRGQRPLYFLKTANNGTSEHIHGLVRWMTDRKNFHLLSYNFLFVKGKNWH